MLLLWGACAGEDAQEAAPVQGATLQSLHTSNLRPAVGEKVWLEAVWEGELPAAEAWEGPKGEAPGLASWVPTRAGTQFLALAGKKIEVDVQEFPLEPIFAPSLKIEPLPQIRSSCPVGLAGPYLVWCTGERVDRVMHLETREITTIQGPQKPSFGPGLLYQPGPGKGPWRLPAPAPEPGTLVIGATEWACDGQRVAAAWADRIEMYALSGGPRTRTEARPLPQQPVAVSGEQALWVQRGTTTEEDIWYRDARAEAHPLARRGISQRFPVATGRWRAWTEPDGVILDDQHSEERRRYPRLGSIEKIDNSLASIGFMNEPSLWNNRVCWEERLKKGDDLDIDLRCSDGLYLDRSGNQLSPQRFGPWLAFTEEAGTFLATLSEVILDDEDPGVPGGRRLQGGYRGSHRDSPVRYTLDWPARGWAWERWESGAWLPMGPVGTGPIILEHPGGDAVRLLPGI